MSKGLKIFIWILVIIAVLGAITFTWGKSAWNKIKFSAPTLQGLDLQGLTLADLANIALAGQEKTVTATVQMNIQNDNSFSIPFSSIRAQLLYNDTVIAKTSDDSSHIVPANGNLPLSDPVNIILNNAGGNLLIEKIKGGKPKINYVINLKVFGIPVPSIKSSFTW